jgi:serine phosphatase RsbU (regulator of sigma subunit)
MSGRQNRFGALLGDPRQLLRITWPLLAAIFFLVAVSLVSAGIMSAVRAYVTGESHWSKGQKDAIFHLLQYARTRNPESFVLYQKALSAPLGDKSARLTLQSEHPDDDVAFAGFKQGLVQVDDIPGVIRLFKLFGGSYLMVASIALWTAGDVYIGELQKVGDELHALISRGDATEAEVSVLATRIETINRGLTPLTVEFSEALATAAKRTQRLLIALMLVFVALLVPAGLYLAGRFLARSETLAKAKEALQREVDIAARIQSTILPTLGGVPRLDVAARMLPAADVGGDCYDIQPAVNGCWIAMGDVAGHGLSTGLVTMMIQSALACVTRFAPDAEPNQAVCAINAVLHDNVRNRMKSDDHVTFVLMRYFEDGRVVYAGAHEELIIWRAATRRCETLLTRGTWLGPMADISRHTVNATLQLQHGDLLVLYTDGVVEAANASREEFGLQRLCTFIEEKSTAPVDDIVAGLFEKVAAWATQQDDDVTAMVMRYVAKA